ncbi:biotin-dependent carboxyltransferase family protein [Ekhidna sp.]|uniref:5-oxoprolinase subunit C family protein n=1 Tax=Ekhidna sp. TaxID=2608089 RepID=UPI003B5920BE
MGKLKVIKTGPMASLQDFGRFGYRRYGIPRSGAMDKEFMIAANKLVGNPNDYPVIEFALTGMELEVVEETMISVVGADLNVNGERNEIASKVSVGDIIKVSAPTLVYAYLGVGGRMKAQEDFGSVSTYTRARFGGLDGQALANGDQIETEGEPGKICQIPIPGRDQGDVIEIRIMKGPEWDLLKELPSLETFQVDGSSDRMGVRLTGAKLECDYQEIASSAVIPGNIQLPADGHPIILMNDCQITGGYPRIGKVVEEDMWKVAQVRAGGNVKLVLIDA